jgi:hypothetical protein
VDFPTPQNSFVCVSLKIGSRARKRTQSAPQTGEEARASARGTRGFGTKPAIQSPAVPSARAALPAPFSYTHRPGRSGAHGPAGSGVDFPTPKNPSVCVSLKIGSRARSHTQSAPQSARPGRAAADLRRRLCTTLGARAAAPSRLPYTPGRLPYTRPPELPLGTPQLAHPIP